MRPSKTVPAWWFRECLISIVQMRLKSIKNIGKITKSMKMIASTKLNRAQKTMEIGRNYTSASNGT